MPSFSLDWKSNSTDGINTYVRIALDVIKPDTLQNNEGKQLAICTFNKLFFKKTSEIKYHSQNIDISRNS